LTQGIENKNNGERGNKYMTKKKIMLFAQLVSEIDISKYKQKEYVNIVKAIYWEIFGKKV